MPPTVAPSPSATDLPPLATATVTPVPTIPETATPVIAVATVVAEETAVAPTVVPTKANTHPPTPSPTFAAYGITQTIGTSVEERPLVSYRFGYGAKTIILVGGIHGGYEWNTIVLAYRMIDYFQENPEQIPANVTLYIIPSANPDGQYLVTGQEGRFTAADVQGSIEPGRFNGNNVDLNRNWDCNWQATGTWGERTVSGGERPFSEPETQALAQFFLNQRPDVVVFWHSKANGVFSGGCGGVHAPSLALTTLFGDAADYPIYERFEFYEVTGDASDWLALQGIPSFSVELKTRSQLDWEQNLAGTLALLAHYARR